MKRLSDHPEFGTLIKIILFMTTCNFQRTSLFHSKVVGVQNEQDSQGFKEMKGHLLPRGQNLIFGVHLTWAVVNTCWVATC